MADAFKPGFITPAIAKKLSDLWEIAQRMPAKTDTSRPEYEFFQAKVTSVSGGKYAWTEQYFDDNGDYYDKILGRSGTTTHGYAKERNSLVATTFPFYVEMRRRIIVDFEPVYEFDAPYVSGAYGIDLSGRTGSIADVTALQILRGVISGTAGAAVFTPDDASASLPGIVNLSTQTLGAGVKTITDGLRVGGALNHTDIASDGAITVSTGSDNLQITVSSSASTLLANNFADTPYMALRQSLAGYAASGGVMEVGGNAPTLVCRKFAAGLEYSVLDGGGTLQSGASGTSGGGDTVRGGIILTLGSGPTITNLTYSGSHAATGDISPAQLTANTNDWNPSGW